MTDRIAREARRLDREHRSAVFTIAAGAAGIGLTVAVVAGCLLVPTLTAAVAELLDGLPLRSRVWLLLAPLAIASFFAQMLWGALRDYRVVTEWKLDLAAGILHLRGADAASEREWMAEQAA